MLYFFWWGRCVTFCDAVLMDATGDGNIGMTHLVLFFNHKGEYTLGCIDPLRLQRWPGEHRSPAPCEGCYRAAVVYICMIRRGTVLRTSVMDLIGINMDTFKGKGFLIICCICWIWPLRDLFMWYHRWEQLKRARILCINWPNTNIDYTSQLMNRTLPGLCFEWQQKQPLLYR